MTKFEESIKAYLDKRAAEDELFAKSYAKPDKSIEECCKFIEAEACDRVANKSGAQSYGMTDEEVYGLAVHYYDEDVIKIKPLQARTEVMKTNEVYTPTEEEKAAAKEAALRQLQEEALRELRTPKKKKVVEEASTAQTSLFD